MGGVVVALARWPARWKSSETGSAHTAKGAARALNAASSEPRLMPSSAREKPRGVRQKDGRGGAGRGSTTSPALEGKRAGGMRRGGSKGGSATAGPASTKEEEHDVDLSGPFVVGGGGVEAGGREGEGCSFVLPCICPGACTPHLLMVFKGRGGEERVRVASVLHPAEGAPGSRVIDVDEDMRA
jgi:hypothetical protein